MNTPTLIILVHQCLFQGAFFGKNLSLRRKLGKPVRGGNSEATLSIVFFIGFICFSLAFASGVIDIGALALMPDSITLGITGLLLALNLLIGLASLKDLGDSWRVGVIEDQQTQLVQGGIYRYTRNPYFVSYLLMFAAYTVLLQNVLLAVLAMIGFGLIHRMIVREERYLLAAHGQIYQDYLQRVPRYLLV